MLNENRLEKLKDLVEKETVVLADHQLFLVELQGPTKEKTFTPFAKFVAKTDEDNAVYLATLNSIPLFEAKELLDLAEAKAKEIYLNNLDEMLKKNSKAKITVN